MTVPISAKTLAGHAFAETQPLAGAADTQRTSFVYFEASRQYPMVISKTIEFVFFDNAAHYIGFVLNEDAPLGQVICVPNPITSPRCTTVC